MSDPQVDPDATVTSLSLPDAAAGLARPKAKRFGWLILIVAAVIVVAAGVCVAVPAVRERVMGWFGITRVPQQKQLAVLEFQALRGSGEDASFTAGLTDAVTAELTQLADERTFQVVPARDLRERHVATPDQARTDFGANLVLEGSLERSGDEVRVDYSLVDAKTRRRLNTRSVKLSATDPFALQDRIVDDAADMLRVQIPPERREALRPHGTQVAGAYTLFLRAKGTIENYDKPENIDTAIGLFRQAVELDPRYALAYAGLGDAYWKKYLYTKDPTLIQSTRSPCEQALHLDDRLSAAHECLGTIAAGTGHYEVAVQEFDRALVSEPTNEDAYAGLARAYESLGRPGEAEKAYQRAIDVRPQYWAGYNSLGTFYFRQNEYDKAAEMFGKVVALVPDSFHGYDNLGAAYLGEGEYLKAIDTFIHSIALQPTAYAYSNIGTSYFYLHQFDEAAANYEQALKLGGDDFELWWNLGEAYHWSDAKKSQAEHAFQQCVSLGTPRLSVDPRDVEAMSVLAVCHSMLKEHSDAFELILSAEKLGPKDAELSFKEALVYTQLRDTEQAVAHLRDALDAGYPVKLARDTPMFDQIRSDPRVQQLFQEK